MNNTFAPPITVAIGADHAGYELKELLKEHLVNIGYTVQDKGTYGLDSVDYPDFAHPVASAVNNSDAAFGVLICGSGQGVAITANKHPKVRAALCWIVDVAKLSRQHNDANILCIPARFVNVQEAKEMLNTFIKTPFEGGRHQGRVAKIGCM